MNRGVWLMAPLLLTAAACSAHHDARAAPLSTSATPPGVQIAVAPTYGYQVFKGTPNVVTRTTGPLVIDSPEDVSQLYGDHEAVLVFHQPVASRCLRSASLDLPADSTSGDLYANVWAYPSAIFKTLRGTTTVPDNGEDLLADDPSDKGVLTGAVEFFDVTDLYRSWQQGGPFAGSETQFPVGSPLIVTVRSDIAGSIGFALHTDLSTIRLRLTTEPGCT